MYHDNYLFLYVLNVQSNLHFHSCICFFLYLFLSFLALSLLCVVVIVVFVVVVVVFCLPTSFYRLYTGGKRALIPFCRSSLRFKRNFWNKQFVEWLAYVGLCLLALPPNVYPMSLSAEFYS